MPALIHQPTPSRERHGKVSARGLREATAATLAFCWKYLVGVALIQHFMTAFLVAGWTTRLAQRTIYKHWWLRSDLPKEGGTFQEFARADAQTRASAHWPNWVLSETARHDLAAVSISLKGIAQAIKGCAGAAWQNLKVGFQIIFTTATLTLPGCVVMLFSWYAGWLNSFNKGYEQAAIGPLTGFLGIGMFIAAMYYVPMAQVRQAATGNWRSFYDFKLVRALIRERFLSCLLLACAYSLFFIPVTIAKAYPYFMVSGRPEWENLSNAQALEILTTYFFYVGFAMFPLYILLRVIAARIYASATLSALRRGAIHEDALAPNEWETLNRLDLLTLALARSRPNWVRATTWVASRAMRVTCGILVFFVWFSFIGQAYTSEFFHKTARGQGWLNQPLVQLPWFSYIPPRLKSAEQSPP